MLTYDMEERGEKPLYEYLYSRIREDILSGHLRGGEALPSKRTLAKQLSVSLSTVENAYAQLDMEGYIYSLPRKGFYVEELSMQEQGNSSTAPEQADFPQPAKASPKVYFADLASNQTEPDNFPFSIWAKLTRKLLSEHQRELMTNSPSGGVQVLREAIAEYLADFRSLRVSPEQIFVGAGTEYLYGQLIQLFGFAQSYASEDPGYEKPQSIFQAYGVKHRRIPMDRQGIDIEALEKSGANVVHVSPSHHFPTGITMPVSRRYALLDWARSGRYIIEDDYDSEFRMNGRPLPTLFGTDHAGRVIYMNTFTKSLASTIRVSYMVLPLALAQRYREKLGFYSCSVPTFEQYTLAAFIREGYFEKHINRMRSISRKKRNLLLDAIKESALGQYVRIAEENAGLHFLLMLNDRIDPRRFAEQLDREEIRLRALDTFYEQGNAALTRAFVMNYSSLPLDKIPETVSRMCRAAEKSQVKESKHE